MASIMNLKNYEGNIKLSDENYSKYCVPSLI
jgi:hypothetical protein